MLDRGKVGVVRAIGRPGGIIGLVALLALVPLIAAAQNRPGQAADSQACRQQCGATMPVRAANPPQVQACLLRCNAAERYMSRQHRTGTPEATGRGGAPAPAPVPGTAGPIDGVPSIWPPRPAEGPAMPGRALVAYAGPPPSRGLAISMPVERMAAHRGAEQECFRLNGNNPCRLLLETQERCLAVSMAVRANGIVITSDPRTYTITHYGSGSGPSRQVAENQAIRDCGQRPLPSTNCRIAAVRCQ